MALLDGHGQHVAGFGQGGVATLTARGALDPTLGEGGARRIVGDYARAMAVDPRDGRITVVTRRGSDGTNALWRFLQ